MNQTLALVIFCTPTTFFDFLGGALIVEINSLKYIFLFIAVCGTLSHCIFFADDCEKKIIGGVPICAFILAAQCRSFAMRRGEILKVLLTA